MTSEAQRLKEKLERREVCVDRKELNRVVKDRLDFGFDSIYFRYAEAIDELALYKAYVNHTDPLDERRHMSHRKAHFYMALEQLLQAHGEEDDIV